MNLLNVLNALLFVIETFFIILLLRETRLIGRKIPPVMWALAGFFAIDALVALNRSELVWSRSESFVYATTFDIAALLMLGVVFLNARNLARAAISSVDLARYRAAEYERARRDYRQIVRHRIMNPLAVVDGAARTLQAEHSLDSDTREQLLQAIIDSAQVLKDVTLEPERRDELERDLDALPRDDADAPSDSPGA